MATNRISPYNEFTFFDGQIINRTTINADYTTIRSDYLIVCDVVGGPIALQLGTATLANGRVVIVKNECGGAGVNNITITGESGETIDGAANIVLNKAFESVMLYSNGVNWFDIAVN